MSEKKKYRSGDLIIADLPGGRKSVPSTVVSVDSDGYSYTIETDDGEVYVLPIKLIRRSRRKSPGRSAFRTGDGSSTGFSPRRVRSGGVSKSPARKRSLSRTRTPATNTRKRSSSRNRVQRQTDNSVTGTPTSSKISSRTNDRQSPVSNNEPARENSESNTIVTRRQTRQTVIEKIIETKERSASVFRKSLRTEFGGRYGALILMLTFPLFVMYVNFACTNTIKCSVVNKQIVQIATGILKNLIYDYKPLVLYVALTKLSQLSVVAPVISSMRHWKPVWKTGTSFLTGLMSMLVLTSVLEYVCKQQIYNWIVYSYNHFMVYSMICGMLLSIWVYVRASKKRNDLVLNPYGQTSSHVYNFYMGREVSPKIWNRYDVKKLMYRTAFILIIIYEVIYLQKSLKIGSYVLEDNVYEQIKKSLDPTILVLIVTQLIYLMDSVLFESAIDTTFDRKDEGFGYMLAMGFALYPYMFLSVLRQAYHNNVQLSVPVLSAVGVVFLIGYYLMHASNAQKNLFKVNPKHPTFSNSHIIETKYGKGNILVDGYWKMCRHPNYLGEIMMHLAWVPFCWEYPAVLVLLSIILLIVHRAYRIQYRCQEKYGFAWNIYCQRVKYLIIPKVF